MELTIFRHELGERLPGIRGLLQELEQSSRGLDSIRALLRYLAQVVETDRLSATDLRQAVTQALSGGSELTMTIAERWVQEGRQDGLFSERQLLLRLVWKRFGDAVMERSRAPLERVEGMAVLEELGEVVLDCADGEAWLATLVRRGNWFTSRLREPWSVPNGTDLTKNPIKQPVTSGPRASALRT